MLSACLYIETKLHPISVIFIHSFILLSILARPIWFLPRCHYHLMNSLLSLKFHWWFIWMHSFCLQPISTFYWMDRVNFMIWANWMKKKMKCRPIDVGSLNQMKIFYRSHQKFTQKIIWLFKKMLFFLEKSKWLTHKRILRAKANDSRIKETCSFHEFNFYTQIIKSGPFTSFYFQKNYANFMRSL